MLKRRFDLAFHLETAEKRHAILVELDAFRVMRHHPLHEIVRIRECALAVDEHLADVLAQVVADGAHHHVVFLIDERGRLGRLAGFLNGRLQLQQVIQIPLQFLRAALDARGAHDHAHAIGNVEGTQGFPQGFPIRALYASGDAPGAGVVGHEHHVAAGQAEQRGEGGALGAALLLLHLHQELLAGGDEFGDAGSSAVAVLLGGPGGAGVYRQVPGYLLGWQETVALRAELDERRLQARLHGGNFRPIDVAFLLLAAAGFDVEIMEALAFHEGNAHLFGLRRVD